MDRNADEAFAPHHIACPCRIVYGGQVHAIEAGGFGELGVAVQRQSRAEAPHDRQQAPCQRDLLFRGKIFFAHAEPAAARRACALDDVRDRQPRLPAIGDHQQPGVG